MPRLSTNRLWLLLIGCVCAHWSTTLAAAAVEPIPVLPILSPADAETHGLRDLRTQVQEDGGVPGPDLVAAGIVKPGADAQLALRQLGKLLFWEQGIGSAGHSGKPGQACASCHFHAGADNRQRNQLSVAMLNLRDDREGDVLGYHLAERRGDLTFYGKPPNSLLAFQDFPFVKNPGQFVSTNGWLTPAAGNITGAASSMGSVKARFRKVRNARADAWCEAVDDPVFPGVRQVEPRNTPTVINAVFNHDNFWDGRADDTFNGVNPFGPHDPNARVLRATSTGIVEETLRLKESSLASQATGPGLSNLEMGCGVPEEGNAQTWPEIAKKLLRKRSFVDRYIPLAAQMIDPNDSLIGSLSRHPDPGANVYYAQLIKRAFTERYWKADGYRVVFSNAGIDIVVAAATASPSESTAHPATAEELADPEYVEEPTWGDKGLWEAASNPALNLPRFTLMEANFALFFGLAVQAYEQLLVADDSPFDRWMRTGQFNSGFSWPERRGLNVFVDKGKCINCHGGPELTNASVRNAQNNNNIIEPMLMSDNRHAIYDNGFYNIGITPTVEDPGRGGMGPARITINGVVSQAPLASSRQRLMEEVFGVNIPFNIQGEDRVPAVSEEGQAVCNDVDNSGFCEQDEPLLGEFQRAAVDGAFKTPGLRNVELQGPFFHNGSVATLKQVVEFYDNGGHFCQFNHPDLDPDITPLDLTEKDKADLVRFLVSLTDERVRYRQAPFDHPAIQIPINGKKFGFKRWTAAVGAAGSATPLEPFMGLNQQWRGQFPRDFRCSPN